MDFRDCIQLNEASLPNRTYSAMISGVFRKRKLDELIKIARRIDVRCIDIKINEETHTIYIGKYEIKEKALVFTFSEKNGVKTFDEKERINGLKIVDNENNIHEFSMVELVA